MTNPEPTVQALFNLHGKVAVLTGATGWLGSAMSRALAEAGATLVVTSREADKAATFAASLPGSGHIGLGFDQGDTDSIPAFVEQVVAKMGQIDILVNNAYGGPGTSIANASAEDFDRAYHTGVTAYFILARAVADHLRSRGAPGSIINISSMYGVVASYPDTYLDLPVNSPPSYHGLKGGLVHLSRHLAVYWAKDNIRVNCIAPGMIYASMVAGKVEGEMRDLRRKVAPLGTEGTAWDIAHAAVFLASDEARWITGVVLPVDGGLMAMAPQAVVPFLAD